MKKVALMVSAIAIIVVSLAAVLILIGKDGNVNANKVVDTYNNSSTDGCDGFILENGDYVDIFCFWTRPNEQTEVQGDGIKIGDTIEYWEEDGRTFVRKK